MNLHLLFHTPLALVVNVNFPAKSIPELIALLKQKPGEISFAHSGPGSSLYLTAELFQAMTGTSGRQRVELSRLVQYPMVLPEHLVHYSIVVQHFGH